MKLKLSLITLAATIACVVGHVLVGVATITLPVASPNVITNPGLLPVTTSAPHTDATVVTTFDANGPDDIIVDGVNWYPFDDPTFFWFYNASVAPTGVSHVWTNPTDFLTSNEFDIATTFLPQANGIDMDITFTNKTGAFVDTVAFRPLRMVIPTFLASASWPNSSSRAPKVGPAFVMMDTTSGGLVSLSLIDGSGGAYEDPVSDEPLGSSVRFGEIGGEEWINVFLRDFDIGEVRSIKIAFRIATTGSQESYALVQPAIDAYLASHPQKLVWADRRPIGKDFLAAYFWATGQHTGLSPINPGGIFPNRLDKLPPSGSGVLANDVLIAARDGDYPGLTGLTTLDHNDFIVALVDDPATPADWEGRNNTNPNGWQPLYTTGLDLSPSNNGADHAAFQANLLGRAVGVMTQITTINPNTQGVILWDHDGQRGPQPVYGYLGDLRQIFNTCPELIKPGTNPIDGMPNTIIDDICKLYTDAGVRVGCTLRNEYVRDRDSSIFKWNLYIGTPEQSAQVLIDTINFCKRRWGMSIFYIDTFSSGPAGNTATSTGGINPLPVSILEIVCNAHPDVLLIPEHEGPGHYAISAPLISGSGGTPPLVKYMYPSSFGVSHNPATPDYSPTGPDRLLYEQQVARGDILTTSIWFNSTENVFVEDIYVNHGLIGL